MKRSSLVMVADRGRLKAFRVMKTPERGLHLDLVETFTVENEQAAGPANAAGKSTGTHLLPVGDWPQLEAEADRRICKKLAERVATILEKEPVKAWSLAAPSSIYGTLLKHLPPPAKAALVDQVKSDLVKIGPSRLPDHFPSLQ